MKGLILAAGRGKRLAPWTKLIPKALIPIKGRPLLGHVVLQFRKTGIKDIGIVIRKKDYFNFKEALKDYAEEMLLRNATFGISLISNSQGRKG